jgi:anti-sigma regulatory factor (Ser/Thr protein kinase)
MLAELSLTLPRDPSAATVARAAVYRRFAGLGRQRLADLALVVSELLPNAVVHGRGAITFNLQHDDDLLRGEVIDEGGDFERAVRDRGPHEVSGRGLLIVQALASRWGIHEGSTHVWFELPDDRAAPGRADPQLGDARRPAELP